MCFRPTEPTAHTRGPSDTVCPDGSWHLPSHTAPPPACHFSGEIPPTPRLQAERSRGSCGQSAGERTGQESVFRGHAETVMGWEEAAREWKEFR